MPTDPPMTAYARLVKAKGNDDYRPCWYEIYFDKPSGNPNSLSGPYRDKTDAENAAHEEAKARNLYLEWDD